MIKDHFLSNILKFDCGIVDFDLKNDFSNIEKFKFAYAKTELSTSSALSAFKNNFYLADVTVKFIKILKKTRSHYEENNEVVIANQRVKKSIIDLARDSFEQDRFHRDPNIPNRLASEIKGQWVENFSREKEEIIVL